MRIKYLVALFLIIIVTQTIAQQVEVQADYNGVGDCVFVAYNNADVPMYLHLNFADLQNTSFPDPLPYVKRLSPGFNPLFTLLRDVEADVPRFNYEIKSFRSNPTPMVDLKFPYLIPFAEGYKTRSFNVENIDGFRGDTKLKSWQATGFIAPAGTAIFASRSGVVVEIAGAKRTENTEDWYNAWNNVITILHADGTLMCYRNVSHEQGNIEIGKQVYAGQKIGELDPNATQLIQLIYHHSTNTKGLLFIIPQFLVEENKNAILNTSEEYSVVHPKEVRGLEMTKRERKKILGLKK